MCRSKGAKNKKNVTVLEPPPVVNARWIPLTKGQFALVDEEDYGKLSEWGWTYHKSSGYALRYSQITMHRQIMNLLNISPKEIQVDHINHNKLDNRKVNLRTVSRQQNRFNLSKYKNNTSGFKGVSWHRNHQHWVARIQVDNRPIAIGSYNDKIQAAKAYDEAAKFYHKEFAYLNFPESK